MRLGLGSDISGGHSLDMADTVRETLSASRLLWRLGQEHLPHLTAREAFYLATAGGGAYFGQVGQFEPGYEFDAVVVDDSLWRGPRDDLDARFQKMIYSAHTQHVTAKYVAGQRLF
jgi:guanine deaminase